jgi:glycosyltransferase involved in cell wall biosynthesis
MKTVTIGIPVHSEPRRLTATLKALHAHTSQQFELVLLPDGPDSAMKKALNELPHLPQLGTDNPRGDAACFNRLCDHSRTPLVVLLESGAQVAPGWLDRLTAALDALPGNALGGPSTNRAWNEQAAFPRCGESHDELVRIAHEAGRRYGAAWKTLEPMYSLADFCYVVRREVIETLGCADEAYGLGPCWEMDYNIRAARAGFRGVWACAAFVRRAPFTARRKKEEALCFDSSKRRYQDKFCALRLRREADGYEPHCKGDACEHFAPPSLIQIRLAVTATESVSCPQQPATVTVTDTAPLVSCIMPTCDRPDFAMQAVRYFERQEYPARELIIVDDGKLDWTSSLPANPAIRYIRLPARASIGVKRNKACSIARGEFVAHWDDDDWYDRRRLAVQLSPLIAGHADISGLSSEIFFDLSRWEFWECSPELHRRLFVENVHGGTLVFRRSLWNKAATYPDRSLAEDALFLKQCVKAGARVARLPNDGVFMYVRHGSNSWSFSCGHYLNSSGWQRVPEPPLPAADRSFYRSRSPAVGREPRSGGSESPLVSCIMPTANRRSFVPHAIRYFLRQDYLNSELIIVDDGADPIEDLIPDDSRIRYHRLQSRRTIGAKRNLACEDARGDVIVHWDDDDWMAPWRVRYQLKTLLDSGADMCGLNRIIYFDVGTRKSWEYVFRSARPWVAGNTFCYFRDMWRKKSFPDIHVGEDVQFLWGGAAKNIVALADPSFYVAVIHSRNVSPKRPRGPARQPYPVADTTRILGDDWSLYESFCGVATVVAHAP